MTTRCLCLSLSAHSTGVLSDVDLMVPMMGVSADSREDPAPRRGFRRPGRGAGGWGPGIAHVALGRRVKARASSSSGRAVYPPGKDQSSRAQPGIRRSLERGAKALESGHPVTAALNSVGQSWDSGQVQLFVRLVTPEFSKFVAENQPETEAKPSDLAARARA